MDKVFFLGIIVGLLSRMIMINLDQKQYPTHPNILTSQLVLAFVASSLGALLVPALVDRSYTSITFLSLAAEQFRQVRQNRRQTLMNIEEDQLVKRGNSFIEEIARTYEVRNYMCIITSFMTVGTYYILTSEFNINDTLSTILGVVVGLGLALILRKVSSRKSIGDIADVSIVKIQFVDEVIMQVGDLKGITNVGLEKDREKFLTKGVGIEIKPKDNSYTNAAIIYNLGQRQAIAYNLYSRLGIYRDSNDVAFVPIPRRNPQNESIMMAFIPMEKDEQKVIEAVKSCPILESAKGKYISLKNYKIPKKGSA